jgi:UDP-N-acetyl-D-galactosamine dehydrogenase
VRNAKALILGITFKENCPDIRNSKVPDIYEELKSFGMEVDVYDPHAQPQEVKQEYAIDLASSMSTYDAIILAVSHKEFLALDVTGLKKNQASVIYDIKAILDPSIVDSRL